MKKTLVLQIISSLLLLLIASIISYVAIVGVTNFLAVGNVVKFLSPIILLLLIISIALSAIVVLKKDVQKKLAIVNLLIAGGFIFFPIQIGNKNFYVVLNSYGMNTVYGFKDSILSLKDISTDSFRTIPNIMLAVRKNDIGNARAILTNNDATVREKSEALLFAQSFDMIKLLVENGADVNYLDNNNNNLLNSGSATSHHSSYKSSKFLFEHGMNPNLLDVQSKLFKETSLHYGDRCFMDKTKVCSDEYQNIEFLLNKGANPNIKNYKGQTPIFTVSDKSKQILIEHNADISVIDNNGETILFRVMDLELFKLLIDKGVDLQHKNNYGKTALESTKSKEIIAYYKQKV